MGEDNPDFAGRLIVKAALDCSLFAEPRTLESQAALRWALWFTDRHAVMVGDGRILHRLSDRLPPDERNDVGKRMAARSLVATVDRGTPSIHEAASTTDLARWSSQVDLILTTGVGAARIGACATTPGAVAVVRCDLPMVDTPPVSTSLAWSGRLIPRSVPRGAVGDAIFGPICEAVTPTTVIIFDKFAASPGRRDALFWLFGKFGSVGVKEVRVYTDKFYEPKARTCPHCGGSLPSGGGSFATLQQYLEVVDKAREEARLDRVRWCSWSTNHFPEHDRHIRIGGRVVQLSGGIGAFDSETTAPWRYYVAYRTDPDSDYGELIAAERADDDYRVDILAGDAS